MAYFLFIDESGQDHINSPYEVLAGLAIKDNDLWKFIREAHEIEINCFGTKYGRPNREIKGRKFLSHKTFRLAQQSDPINLFERTQWAKEALENGATVSGNMLTALAQAKISYVKQIFQLCQEYRCKIFGAIVKDHNELPAEADMLRRDYIYLFERFYYFLEDQGTDPMGIVVFDELDKSASHILLNQMDKYFKNTVKGRARSSLIVPEPFFVHSDLTTGIQVVDFVAYILSWNFRMHNLDKEGREELNGLTELVKSLRYKTVREIGEVREHTIWSVCVV